jgi:hypothetical protein
MLSKGLSNEIEYLRIDYNGYGSVSFWLVKADEIFRSENCQTREKVIS